MNHLFTLLRISTGVGIVAFLVASGGIGWSALEGLVRAWPLTLAALAVMFGMTATTAWRQSVLFGTRGLALPLGASLRLTLIGLFFSTCLPGSTGGDLVKVHYAADGRRDRYAEAAALMVLDRLLGLLGVFAWLVLVAPLFHDLLASSGLLRVLLLTIAVTGLGMILAGSAITFLPLVGKRRVATALVRVPAGKHFEQALDVLYGLCRSPRALLGVIGVTLLSNTLGVVGALLLAQAILPSGATWPMVFLVPLAFVCNGLPLTPGGLGVGEAALAALFGLVGLVGGVELILAWRLMLITIGLVGLGFYLWGRRGFVQRRSDEQVQQVVERGDPRATPLGSTCPQQ